MSNSIDEITFNKVWDIFENFIANIDGHDIDKRWEFAIRMAMCGGVKFVGYERLKELTDNMLREIGANLEDLTKDE
jgi:hypothetical protein